MGNQIRNKEIREQDASIWVPYCSCRELRHLLTKMRRLPNPSKTSLLTRGSVKLVLYLTSSLARDNRVAARTLHYSTSTRRRKKDAATKRRAAAVYHRERHEAEGVVQRRHTETE
ncbi:hypothetical protein ElyMa_005528100 [Elysia marginata]|uniref:Uncharacterized protein n=1 Tax=Elysia marginata TaxID=1093978 RepID=A0AAV4EXW9_9GAST|nr:hypothetical protein ElyMa_005528100 [Elysia marginata]